MSMIFIHDNRGFLPPFVSALCCDFGSHVQPDVVALSFKLKTATLISGAPSFLLELLLDMQIVRWVPRICTTRFSLKSLERFMLMEYSDDTSMFMYGQMCAQRIWNGSNSSASINL